MAHVCLTNISRGTFAFCLSVFILLDACSCSRAECLTEEGPVCWSLVNGSNTHTAGHASLYKASLERPQYE